MRTPAPALLGLALLLGGCTYAVPAPEGDVDARAVYQTIANQLPRATFGWGPPPGIVDLAASMRGNRREAPDPARLVATERGFRFFYEVVRPREAWVPYTALAGASWTWRAFPNLVFLPLLVVPIQAVRATVVLDAAQVDGLLANVEADCRRLEAISREVGLGGPWSHAQAVRSKLAADAAEHGQGRVTLHFDYVLPLPPWLPTGGPAREAAEALAWAQAHADAPLRPPPASEEDAAQGAGPASRPSGAGP